MVCIITVTIKTSNVYVGLKPYTTASQPHYITHPLTGLAIAVALDTVALDTY